MTQYGVVVNTGKRIIVKANKVFETGSFLVFQKTVHGLNGAEDAFETVAWFPVSNIQYVEKRR